MTGIASTTLAVVAVVAVSEAIADLGELGAVAADGSRLALIAGGMLIAYRVTSKAHREAVDLYREASADAAAALMRERADAAVNLAREREEWARREASLLAQLHYLGKPPPAG